MNYYLNLDGYKTQKELIYKIIGSIECCKTRNCKINISDLINLVNT